LFSGCGGGASSTPPSTASMQLSVQTSGVGQGTISSNPAGINCGQTCSASFADGTQVTLTATPTGTSFFAGWSGSCSGVGTCKVPTTKNLSAPADFATGPWLAGPLAGRGTGTARSDPAGIDCGQVCNASFDPGTKVTLTATPSANSVFTAWSGACSGS